MKKADLKDILQLVKTKLCQEPEPACGLFWTDSEETKSKTQTKIHEPTPTPDYAVSEPVDEESELSSYDTSATTKYGIQIPDDLFQATSRYAVGEEDGGGGPIARYGVCE